MVKYRIGIARFWHESNSFSCVNTEAGDFESYQAGVLSGSEILAHTGRNDEIAGMIDVLTSHGAEIVPLLSAGALPSGLISEDAVNLLESTLRSQLDSAGQLDGVCIAPHGAMSSTQYADFDGYILQVLREQLGSDAPITVALDCHAVVTRQMVKLATALVASTPPCHRKLLSTR